ncbi:MAG: oligosaccharide flippase family protein [Chitinivibrionales bacterium]|nr:oligosaccharide flippase family protein [Chitinivibrionales bacterium]MBD3395941.1 oligosaccharide flippase family protein [Chitinivibrionales bacterium]
MARFLRQTGIVFVLMLLARGSGFIRNLLLVNRLSVGAHSDAFFISIAAIDFFILVSGLNAMKSVATTTFTQARRAPGEANRYLSSLLYGLVGYGLVLGLPLFAFPDLFARIFAPGFDPAAARITALCLRILAILVLGKGLLPILASLLGVQGRFAMQNMFMPLINCAAIGVILLSPLEGMLVRFSGVFAACFMLSCAGSYFALSGPKLHLVAVPISTLKSYVSRFARLAYPLLFATAAYSVAGIADKMIASFFQRGVVTSLGIAYSLCFMTVGVLLEPVSRVLFPHFSRLYFENAHERLARDFENGQFIVTVLFVPVSLFLVFFSSDIIAAVLLARKIEPDHIEAAARMLSIYGIALVFNASLFLPSYLLQSAQKNSYVGKAALAAFGGNIICSIVFSLVWGYVGIPLGTVVGFGAYFLLLGAGLRRHLGIGLGAPFCIAAAVSGAASCAAVLIARAVTVPPAWLPGPAGHALPLATCAARFAVYITAAGLPLMLIFGKRMRVIARL